MRLEIFYQWIALGIAISVFSGCDAVYRLLDKNGAQEKELVGDIVPMGHNEKVLEIQTLLNIYGYAPGSADGVLGLKTRDAVERFQKEQGIEPSRFVNKETWDKLTVFQENGIIVDSELNVRLVQTLLEAAGCNPGSVDGKMGQRTTDAVKRFQAKHRLKVDGKIGYNTLKMLAEYLPEVSGEAAQVVARR